MGSIPVSRASNGYKARPSVRELARRHTKIAIQRIKQLCDGAESEAVQLGAANSLLDRGWGRPTQEITGADGGPLVVLTRSFDADEPLTIEHAGAAFTDPSGNAIEPNATTGPSTNTGSTPTPSAELPRKP